MQLLGWLFLVVGCEPAAPPSESGGGDLPEDSGSGDSGVPDTGDSAPEDSGGADSGDTGSGDTGSGDTGSGDTGSGEAMGEHRVDTAGGVVPGSVDAAVGPDGSVVASWVQGTDVYVRRSLDGGATWEDPVRVDDATVEPLVAWGRRPYVAADAERVAVVFNDPAGVVYVYTADARAPLAFGDPVILGAELGATFQDYPKGVFADGDLWVGWQAFTPTGWMALAHEAGGWETLRASATVPGQPCECCPLDLVDIGGGQVSLAFRNNDDDLREHWVVHTEGGEPGASGQVSHIEGILTYCPMEGPRIDVSDEGTLAVWTSASPSGMHSVWTSWSEDGVTGWSDASPLEWTMETALPTVATAASGNRYVSYQMDDYTELTVSPPGGLDFESPTVLRVSEGRLGFGQLAAGGDVTVVAGDAGNGSAWVIRLE